MKKVLRYLGRFLLILLVILFFPLSLVFVAYYRQRKARKEYFARED